MRRSGIGHDQVLRAFQLPSLPLMSAAQPACWLPSSHVLLWEFQPPALLPGIAGTAHDAPPGIGIIIAGGSAGGVIMGGGAVGGGVIMGGGAVGGGVIIGGAELPFPYASLLHELLLVFPPLQDLLLASSPFHDILPEFRPFHDLLLTSSLFHCAPLAFVLSQ